MKIIAIIVAGGQGKRMGQPKQFIRIAGKPMLAWTVDALQKVKAIDGIILVVTPGQEAAAKRLKGSKVIAVVPGGRERQDSVRNGLAALPKGAQIVLIHDGARPAVGAATINDTIRAAKQHGAAIAAVPVKDTLKKIRKSKFEIRKVMTVMETVARNEYWAAQTPQTFTAGLIKKAYEHLKHNVTDDAAAVENLGVPVAIVMGAYNNLKVTTPEDLPVMAAILKGR
ncbi:MAG: 2-C-methyl-D-erythritol 4-phosphate cytidylyltransferase [Candidatus Saganbacteria bacterium]|nr:2-C-methyl-D-erythritol 4-phosphate cytidylyltransferase [Candidatus Saganbacteria bacterium]